VASYDTLFERLLWRRRGMVHRKMAVVFDAVFFVMNDNLCGVGIESGEDVKLDDGVARLVSFFWK